MNKKSAHDNLSLILSSPVGVSLFLCRTVLRVLHTSFSDARAAPVPPPAAPRAFFRRNGSSKDATLASPSAPINAFASFPFLSFSLAFSHASPSPCNTAALEPLPFGAKPALSVILSKAAFAGGNFSQQVMATYRQEGVSKCMVAVERQMDDIWVGGVVSIAV